MKILNQVITTMAGSGASILLGLLGVILSARFLGADGRGELAVFMTIPLMAASIVGFGTGYSSVHFTVLDKRAAYGNWRSALAINLWTVPLITICVALYYFFVGNTKLIVIEMGLLVCVVTAAAIYSSAWGVYLGLRDFDVYNIKKIIPQFLYFLSILSAIVFHEAMYVALVYCLLLVVYSVVEFFWGIKFIGENDDKKRISDLVYLKYGLHSFFPTIPQVISQKIDLLFAISVFDHRFVGLYAVSASVGQLFQGLNASLGNILLAKSKESTGKISYLFFLSFVKLIAVANLTILVAFYFLGDFAIDFFLGVEFSVIKSTALLLIISGALYGVNCMLYDGFRASSLQSIPVISEVLSLASKVGVLTYFSIVDVVTMNDLAIAVLVSAVISLIYSTLNLFAMRIHEKNS